ncbi:MAG: energy-coupled thiamine transporter ThiT [Firmicutes bacterium]|uniref:Energy-coupled thiamine transporter ThiT n=1 Tax=Candidatus Onthovivens merdipullorum TaxID=2840889 RepID=A0A9D9DHR2_9BACL|nr:energy-coupled thiamine transporter ThiT [Candidatus Onthovivens merdipullorum]
MEKLKKLLLGYWCPIVIGLMTILFIGFSFLPLLDFELTNENSFSLSLIQIILGGEYGEVTFKFDALFCFIYLVFILGVIFYFCGYFIKFKNLKTKVAFLGWSLVWILVALILLSCSELFIPNYSDIGEYISDNSLNPLGFALEIICLVVIILLVLRDNFTNLTFKVNDIVEMGMLIALALCLDKIKLWSAPTGGSINLAGIPLLILSIRLGFSKGLIGSSLIFGIISCFMDTWGFQTFPFDYFIAFSGYSIAGLAYSLYTKFIKINNRKNDLIAICLSLCIGAVGVFITRMVGSSISSMIYYDYSLSAALIYQIGYVGPSAALSLAACLVLAKPIEMINHRFKVKSSIKTPEVNSNDTSN